MGRYLTWRILHGDVRETLATLPAGSVQTCVTSPPYWGLRDYGEAGQIGLEQTPDAYVANMVAVFREVRRVLRDDGTLWLNLGDSYATGTTAPQQATTITGAEVPASWAGRSQPERCGTPAGLKTKDLVGIPWMVAFALRADGWYLRSDIIWHKPNPMPESVTDRPTKAHEYIFLLTKSARYYYDAAAIAEEGKDWSVGGPGVGIKETHHYGAGNGGNAGLKGIAGRYADRKPCPDCETGAIGAVRGGWPITCPTCNGHATVPAAPTTRNKRTVWTVPTQPYSGAHFATFPEALIEPCILAGTSERGQCPACGAAWERVVERELVNTEGWGAAKKDHHGPVQGQDAIARNGQGRAGDSRTTTTGWQPSCDCNAGDPVPQTVLDPFNGSGTTGAVSVRHQRHYIGVELNAAYIDLARQRIGAVAPLFAEEVR